MAQSRRYTKFRSIDEVGGRIGSLRNAFRIVLGGQWSVKQQ